MTRTDVPWFVAEKRAKKADQIARHLRAIGVEADAAIRYTDAQRREAELGAGVKHPGSDTTWRSVIQMLAGSHASAARCLTCGLGDPEGIDAPPQPFGHTGPCSK